MILDIFKKQMTNEGTLSQKGRAFEFQIESSSKLTAETSK
jgi:hypothetical protein